MVLQYKADRLISRQRAFFSGPVTAALVLPYDRRRIAIAISPTFNAGVGVIEYVLGDNSGGVTFSVEWAGGVVPWQQHIYRKWEIGGIVRGEVRFTTTAFSAGIRINEFLDDRL